MFVRKRTDPEPPTPLLKQRGRPTSDNSTGEVRFCRRHGLVVFHRYSSGKAGYRWRCKRCVVNLHFHHVDPSQKSFGVTVASGKSLDTYRAEAQKCVLVCANCHGEIEGG